MINVRRGLFRLWVVVSMTWVLIGGVLTFQSWLELSSLTSQSNIDNASREKRVAELRVLSPEKRDSLGETLYEVELENLDKTSHTVVLSKKMLEQDGEIQNQLSEAKKNLQERLMMTLIPPLVLFILGISLLWVLLGFKPIKVQ